MFTKYNFRSNKLRYALKRRSKKDCSLPNSRISSSGLCFTTKCVYSLQCEECSVTYIGSTIRLLHAHPHT